MASMGEELRATDYLQMRSEPWYKEHEHKEKEYLPSVLLPAFLEALCLICSQEPYVLKDVIQHQVVFLLPSG